MTYGELRFDLTKLAPGIDPDTLDGFINDRYQSILEHKLWKDLEADATLTTTATIGVYDVPADFHLPMEGRDAASDSEITFISRTELNRAAPARTATGAPQVYSLVDSATYEVYPVPDGVATYTFRYIKRLPRFAPSDTAVVIPAWISIQCLKAGVKADVCELNKDYSGTDRNEAKFRAEREKMAVTDAKRVGPQRIRLSSRFFASSFLVNRRADHRRQMP